LTNGRPIRTASPSLSVSGRPSPSSSTGLTPCHVVTGSTTSTLRFSADCTTTGAAALRPRTRTSNRYSPDLPPGAWKRTKRERLPRPRLRMSRSPTRRSVHAKRPPGELTATVARVPAATGSESDCALR
jgi:hypothetical protein